MKYRMYVDEVGHASHKSCRDELYRYLSLTGVILELGYVKDVVVPALEGMKARFFDTHPDDPVILHRQDIVRKNPPFQCLHDPETCLEFDRELLQLLNDWEYQVVTVIIDKQEQLERYRVWRHDPYHYAMQVLLERYVTWLELHGFTGDVLAESRGGREDQRLKASFEGVWTAGTEYVRHEQFRVALSSKQLKVKPKANNIAGLQLADLIAYPSRKGLLQARNNLPAAPDFGAQVLEILHRSKYLRNRAQKIEGWGTKWLP
ncbi:MAG: DUF3800 domain-containing protein [Armatimonadia bacterium]